ncbi:hypothetical protein [Halalkalibacter okhensis]|uniref:Uncharacterized protein n=1 Tax=Halalkalibacter okhensis TaxID=333138 RepID=A0A0B0IGJ8_9BACI|nr:hypothetical protein [Halalkalibacter okhensis]KHF40390.1 hypothetical protein LQ50_08940 [Halalkalibacter okhensis]
MDEMEQKQKELEMKIKEVEAKLETLQIAQEQQQKQSDISEIVDAMLSEKESALAQELENKIQQQQLQLIKWSAGTGISVIAVVISIFRIFFV